MLKLSVRKIKRKFRILNYKWTLIVGIASATIMLFILLSISGGKKMRQSREFETNNAISGRVTLVDQPFCKIQLYGTPHPGVNKMANTPPPRYTDMLKLPDGSNVVYKLTKNAEKNCIRCCAKSIFVDMNKSFPGGYLPTEQRLNISREYCNPFVKIFPLRPNLKSNFILTKCEVQCNPNPDKDEYDGNPVYTKLHPILSINTKVQRKLEFWDQQNMQKRPLKVLLLNIDSLGRSEIVTLLPKSIRSMQALGFVSMDGHALIGGASISNYAGSLTGLAQEDWDATCAFSETGHFTFTCPWIWKDFSKAQFVTAYADLHGMDMFQDIPTDYFLGQDVSKLVTLTTDQQSSIDLLLEYTLKFNQKFAQYPTFSITKLPSIRKFYPEFDNQLSKFLLTIKDLKETFIAFYSNNGPIEQIPGTRGPNLDRFNPVLFIRRFRNSERQNSVKYDSVLVKNSRLLTTVWDFHETLRHVLRTSCFTGDNSYGWQNETFGCLQQYPKLAGASSLLTPVSQYRTCKSSHVPAETCPCNRALTSAPFLTQLMPLARIAMNHLNSLVPQKKICSEFEFVTLQYAYVVEQNEAVVGMSVTGLGESRKQVMRVEQRVSVATRKAVGLPLWTSYRRPNGFLCLPFPLNPNIYFIHKLYCLCIGNIK